MPASQTLRDLRWYRLTIAAKTVGNVIPSKAPNNLCTFLPRGRCPIERFGVNFTDEIDYIRLRPKGPVNWWAPVFLIILQKLARSEYHAGLARIFFGYLATRALVEGMAMASLPSAEWLDIVDDHHF